MAAGDEEQDDDLVPGMDEGEEPARQHAGHHRRDDDEADGLQHRGAEVARLLLEPDVEIGERGRHGDDDVGQAGDDVGQDDAGVAVEEVETSSIAVYGSSQTPMTEDMIPVPEDSYGISKFAVEQELRVTHEMFGLEYVIFRPHNVYGPRQNIADRYRNVVGIFMNQLLQGEPMTIFGDGEQQRAFSDIDDVAPVIAASVENDAARNQVFNVGADIPFTVNKLAQVIAGEMGVPCNKRHLHARNEVKLAFSDHSKCKSVFGDRRLVTLQEGIKKMAAWVKAHGARESGVFGEIEIMKNMPPSWASAFSKAANNR